MKKHWTVEEAAGRLDAWLAGAVDGLSRSQAGRAITQGRVHVNGAPPAKAGQKVRVGDAIAFTPETPAPDGIIPQDLPLNILYQDGHLLIVDKDAGVVVHPAQGHPDGTLMNAIAHHIGTLEGGAAERPGLVHRIDKDTSGVLVIARDAQTHAHLSAQFKDHSAFRRYILVVYGPKMEDEGLHDTAYGRHPTDRKRMTSRNPVGRERTARSRWSVSARGQALALVICALETGRTHQIRVHMSEHGHPVVADPIYGHKAPSGGGGTLAIELAAARRMPRLALHAVALGVVHPDDGTRRLWIQEPPEDIAGLVAMAFGPDALDQAMAEIRQSGAEWMAGADA